jgi:hypothetical protein
MDHPQPDPGRDPDVEPPIGDRLGDEELDPGASTEMFQAFVRGEAAGGRAAQDPSAGYGAGAEPGKAVGAPFRLLTLAAGVVAFLVIAWLLLSA